jgi:uncharacterized protein (DUF885 family)
LKRCNIALARPLNAASLRGNNRFAEAPMIDQFIAPSRRAFVAGLAATTAAAGVPASAFAAAKRRAAVAPINALLATFADELLVMSPESATGLGLDSGKHAGLRAKLDEAGIAGRDKAAAQFASMRVRLDKLDDSRLTPRQQLQGDTVDYALKRAADGARFPYGGGAGDGFGGGATPYVLTQQNGAITNIGEFLNSQHPVKTAADAEAYLARIAAFGRVLDQESAQIKDDAAKGVMPPAFVAKTALGQLQEFRSMAAKDQSMVASLATRAKAAGLKGDWAARCTKMIDSIVYPALDRQIAAFTDSTRAAPETAGVQRLPEGDAYYAYGLRLGTTTTLPADEIHRTGLAQNAEIKAKIDDILKSQGMTQGTVGERVVALNSDPRFLFPDDDAGRAQLIAYIKGKIAAQRALMPRISHMAMKAPVDVKRVPPDIQDGAALGYMNFASLDGSRPAIYYVNLKTTKLWPKYQLASLSAHEAIPGHAWQGAYLAEHSAEIPKISSMMGFNAFVEGWALYAEQLMDEFGLYKDDPFGRIGYLQAQQFRACRLVVDTGLHSKQWTREQSIDFLVSETGKGRNAMTSETDRYCVSPGQACGYKVGHNQIVALRDKAKAALGAKFDPAAFNDALVQTGGVPLSLVEGVVDRMIARG